MSAQTLTDQEEMKEMMFVQASFLAKLICQNIIIIIAVRLEQGIKHPKLMAVSPSRLSGSYESRMFIQLLYKLRLINNAHQANRRARKSKEFCRDTLNRLKSQMGTSYAKARNLIPTLVYQAWKGILLGDEDPENDLSLYRFFHSNAYTLAAPLAINTIKSLLKSFANVEATRRNGLIQFGFVYDIGIPSEVEILKIYACPPGISTRDGTSNEDTDDEGIFGAADGEYV